MNCMCVILYIYIYACMVCVLQYCVSYVHNILVILCICEQVLEALTVVEPQ